MKQVTLTSALVMMASLNCFAGPKEDFITARDEATKKNQPKCKELKPTPGRQGTVMKWKTCSSDSIELDGCTLTCPSASSKIGG